MSPIANTVATRFGAIALLDALGFKGIWKRFPAEQILNTLATIQREVEELKAEESHMGIPLVLEAHFFSDTIAISASIPDAPDVDVDTCGALLSSVAYGAGLAQAVAACFEPLLAYRGCIAVGKMATHGAFVIGEAVDEAAQYMEGRGCSHCLVFTAGGQALQRAGVARSRAASSDRELRRPSLRGSFIGNASRQSNLASPQADKRASP